MMVGRGMGILLAENPPDIVLDAFLPDVFATGLVLQRTDDVTRLVFTIERPVVPGADEPARAVASIVIPHRLELQIRQLLGIDDCGGREPPAEHVKS